MEAHEERCLSGAERTKIAKQADGNRVGSPFNVSDAS